MKQISNVLRDAIYNHNVKAGWWDEPVREDGTVLALIHSEVTESYVGFTQDLPDPHVPNTRTQSLSWRMLQFEFMTSLVIKSGILKKQSMQYTAWVLL